MGKNSSYFNSDKHITDIFIALSSDKITDGSEDQLPGEIRTHFENCEYCRDAVLDIFSATLSSGTSRVPGPVLFSKTESHKRPYKFRLFLRTAATFAVLAIISGIYMFLTIDHPAGVTRVTLKNRLQSSHKKTVKITPERSVKDQIIKKTIETKISSLSENTSTVNSKGPFKDNPNLEYMVDSPQRGRMIQIVSPKFRILEKREIIFKWENHIDKDLVLKLLNNKNKTLYTFKVKGNMVKFSGKLNPGLYYWKLEDSENLYHVGKFLIEE